MSLKLVTDVIEDSDFFPLNIYAVLSVNVQSYL